MAIVSWELWPPAGMRVEAAARGATSFFHACQGRSPPCWGAWEPLIIDIVPAEGQIINVRIRARRTATQGETGTTGFNRSRQAATETGIPRTWRVALTPAPFPRQGTGCGPFCLKGVGSSLILFAIARLSNALANLLVAPPSSCPSPSFSTHIRFISNLLPRARCRHDAEKVPEVGWLAGRVFLIIDLI